MSSSTNLPPTLSVRKARELYFARNGFDVDAYQARSFQVYFCGLALPLPNSRSRRRTVPFHDLHHVLTGYGTDILGEAELSAWELVGGCPTAFLWWIKMMSISAGLWLNPRRVIRAALAARGQRSLFHHATDIDALDRLLDMSLAELRGCCRVLPDGQADRAARWHERAPRSGAHAT